MNTGPVASLLPLIREGKLRPLAYTGAKRHPLLPDVPTMIESGYPQVGWQPDVWQAIFAPAGTPSAVVEKLNSEVNAALKLPEVQETYARLGADIPIMSVPEFTAFLAAEVKKWPPIIKEIGRHGAVGEQSAMRRFIGFIAGLAIGLGCALVPAQAQQYPDRPIKLVVPFVPGSPVDVLGRLIAQQMTTRLGQSVVIENRPGAGTSTATKQVQSTPPDGYTLLMMGQTLVYVGLLYPDIGFDPAKAFAPVATLAGWSHVMLAANNVPATSVKELIAYVKANPGKVTFGYGLGTSPQIVGKSFELAAGLELLNVPYKGGEQVRIDLLGGRIALNFSPVSNALALIQDGKVRALAVTSAERDRILWDVPTFKESGFPDVGFNPDVWQGIVAPLGTPAPIVDKLNAAINDALRSDEVQSLFQRLRFDPMINSPAEFTTFLAIQAQRWAPIIKATGLKGGN